MGIVCGSKRLLSSYLGSPRSRLRDLADVIELIKANQLPRTFDLHPEVLPQFLESWDGLEEEARQAAATFRTKPFGKAKQ